MAQGKRKRKARPKNDRTLDKQGLKGDRPCLATNAQDFDTWRNRIRSRQSVRLAINPEYVRKRDRGRKKEKASVLTPSESGSASIPIIKEASIETSQQHTVPEDAQDFDPPAVQQGQFFRDETGEWMYRMWPGGPETLIDPNIMRSDLPDNGIASVADSVFMDLEGTGHSTRPSQEPLHQQSPAPSPDSSSEQSAEPPTDRLEKGAFTFESRIKRVDDPALYFFRKQVEVLQHTENNFSLRFDKDWQSLGLQPDEGRALDPDIAQLPHGPPAGN